VGGEVEVATGEDATGARARGGLIPGIREYGSGLQGDKAAAALSRGYGDMVRGWLQYPGNMGIGSAYAAQRDVRRASRSPEASGRARATGRPVHDSNRSRTWQI
jgi:hypothetical protein